MPRVFWLSHATPDKALDYSQELHAFLPVKDTKHHAEDSDGDSWMEVVEGSPGPSLRNSKASLVYDRDEKVDSTRRTASWVADDTWVSEFEEEYQDKKGDYENGKLQKQQIRVVY